MGSDFFQASPGGAWTSQFSFAFQAVAFPLALWFKPVCVLLALFWLIFRASQVLKKPLDELASLLGFDIPLTPTIDLATVKADGALVHWTLPDKQRQKSSLRYEVHLNGAVIDAVSIHESAVTITGLQPAAFYVVRVALVNSLDFGSKSAAVRFRTKPASSGDFFVPVVDGHETDDAVHERVPRIRPYSGLKDITPALPLSTVTVREAPTGLIPGRRSSGRKFSPATIETKSEPVLDDAEAREAAETLQQLTERLDAIRRETDEAEKQAKEEEEEERKLKEELTRERDDLKSEVLEKERASRNLKREVNVLERQNTAAQNERAKQERLLLQKKQDRQKLKDDMVRWQREVEEMKADVQRIQRNKVDYLAQMDQQMDDLRQKQVDKTANLQSLDHEVKEKTAEVKKLERSLKNSSPNGTEPEPSLVQQYQQDAEEERAWQMHRQALQQQYTIAYQKMESAKRFHAEQMRYLDSLRGERRRAEEMAQYASPPPTQERIPRRGDSQRSRQAHRHSISDSPRLASFPLNAVSQNPFTNSMTNIVPGAFSSAPFLNIQNGMTIAAPTEGIAMSDEDKDRLTGGAPMSPGAGAELIPADLFAGEGDHRMDRVPPLPGLGSLPGLAGSTGPPPLPPLMSSEFAGQGPASPVSASSRSPSVFASPRVSLQNLPMSSPDNNTEADRRSIRSTRSNRAASGTGSRFSGLFGIKPRSKTTSDDGPALSKASSMPRQDQNLIGLDASTRKRNSSISGTMLGGPSLNEGTLEAGAERAATAPSKRHFGLFSREKSGGWPSTFTSFGRRPASPRPGSTHSTELPRPSVDNSRWGVDTWPSSDAGSAANRGSPLAFGQGWNPPGQQSRIYGSRHPSRRPSLQYGAAGPPEDILEDDDDDDRLDLLNPDQEPQLAPIGTKPTLISRKQMENAAALNPNAKDFKSFFSSMKLSKSKEATTPGPLTPSGLAVASAENEDSPPNSRKSRDARSLNTNESSLAESGRNSVELARTSSYSASDAPAPSPSLGASSRESFMQKITRKSSSSKFSLPTFRQREKARADGPAGSVSSIVASGPLSAGLSPAEDEEDALSASVGSVKDRDHNRSSGRGWSNVLKLARSASKRGNDTPSLSGLSLTSGTEDGDLEEDEEDE